MIYLDHAATSPPNPRAMAAMAPFLSERFGNPSGLYLLGREAQAAVDDARGRIAGCLNAGPREILLTSGGTESVNTALIGIAYAMRRAGAGNHVVTTAIEHHAGLHAAQFLEELGFDVTPVGCDSSGVVRVSEIQAALRPETVLVSAMLANNEVGAIQPIAEIAEVLRAYARRSGHRVLLHTDAVQAPGWIDLDVDRLGVDALSLSCHKFGGAKGSGVLYLRRATPFRQLLHGGGQEMQKRAGTENVAGIAAAAVALEDANVGMRSRGGRVRALRDRLRDRLLAEIPETMVNGVPEGSLPGHLNVSFSGIESERLVTRLDARGIAASSGSACSNSTWEPSHVLMAMGIHIRDAIGSVRFSLGPGTTAEEIDAAAAIIPVEVAAARAEAAVSQ